MGLFLTDVLLCACIMDTPLENSSSSFRSIIQISYLVVHFFIGYTLFQYTSHENPGYFHELIKTKSAETNLCSTSTLVLRRFGFYMNLVDLILILINV